MVKERLDPANLFDAKEGLLYMEWNIHKSLERLRNSDIPTATVCYFGALFFLLAVSAVVGKACVNPDVAVTERSIQELVEPIEEDLGHDPHLLLRLVGRNPSEVGMKISVDHGVPTQPYKNLIDGAVCDLSHLVYGIIEPELPDTLVMTVTVGVSGINDLSKMVVCQTDNEGTRVVLGFTPASLSSLDDGLDLRRRKISF